MNNTTIAPDQIFGHDVLDSAGNKIGTVDNVWIDDATNDLEFIGVKTGWLFGKTHIIPVQNADISNSQITVPFGQDQIKDAPSFSGDQELSPADEDGIYQYYGVQRSTSASPSGLPAGGENTGFTSTAGTYDNADTSDTTSGYTGDRSYTDTTTGDTQAVALSEEELQVGKQQVETGRVRLRKVVHTEHEEVPVELQREQVSIERVSATDADVPSTAFQDQEIEVPVMREEPVVGKEAHVVGGVQLNKNVETESRTVTGDVRKEDVEVDDSTTNAEGYNRTSRSDNSY